MSLPLSYLGLWCIEQVEVYNAEPAFVYSIVIGFSFLAAIIVLLSPILLPVYAVYLVRINRQRKENGTTNLFLTMFHILSFMPPLLGFLVFWVWASAQGA